MRKVVKSVTNYINCSSKEPMLKSSLLIYGFRSHFLYHFFSVNESRQDVPQLFFLSSFAFLFLITLSLEHVSSPSSSIDFFINIHTLHAYNVLLPSQAYKYLAATQAKYVGCLRRWLAIESSVLFKKKCC